MTTTIERPRINGQIAAKVAVVYIRESDARQGGGTMTTQTEQAMRFLENEGFVFSKLYQDDESGLLETRPGYQQMLQAARDGEYQVVVIPRYDRFGRDDAEYFPRLREFHKLGVEVLSATEPNGNSFVRGVLILMANEESRRISARTIPNKLRRAREGFWNGNNIFGYNLSRLMPDGSQIPSKGATQEQRKGSLGTVLTPNEQAPLVQECFRRYGAGEATLVTIVDYLRENGVPKTRSGVKHMLVNRAYLGLISYGGRARSQLTPSTGEVFEVKGKHEALINQDTFDRVQERLGLNRRWKRASVTAKHILSGLVTCGLCGARMQAQRGAGRRWASYWCVGRYGGTLADARCTNPFISERKIDAQVKTLVLDALRPFEMDGVRKRARLNVQSDAAKRAKDSDSKRTSLERRVVELEERLTNVEDKMIDGLLGRERYLVHRDGINQKLEQVKRDLDALPKVKQVNVDDVFAALDSMDFDTLDDEGWRHLLTSLTNGVTWSDGVATIRWKAEIEAMLTV